MSEHESPFWFKTGPDHIPIPPLAGSVKQFCIAEAGSNLAELIALKHPNYPKWVYRVFICANGDWLRLQCSLVVHGTGSC
jgi:hypothetical protein